MSVRCTGWTKEGSCVSMSVLMFRARTTALVPAATSCSQMGGAVRVSDKRQQRTKAHSQGPGCRSGWVFSSRGEYLWFRKTRSLLAAELLVSAEVSVGRAGLATTFISTPEACSACQWNKWPHPFPAEGIFRTWGVCERLNWKTK